VVPCYDDLSLAAVRDYRDCMALLEKQRQATGRDSTQNLQPPVDLIGSGYEPLPRSFVGFEGFLSARLLVQVLQKMGPPFERSRLREATESLHDVQLGIDAPVSFDAHRHQGMDRVYFTVVKEGRFVSFTDWERWRTSPQRQQEDSSNTHPTPQRGDHP
jgi:hypothetical protein